MSNFFRTLDKAIESCSSSGDVASLVILERLRSYTSTGSFSSYKRAKELIALNGLTWKDASLVLGIQPDSVKRARYMVSKEIWDIVGEDFFNRLDEGDLDYCESVVEALYDKNVTSPIVSGVSLLLRSLVRDDDLDSVCSYTELSEYASELEFLAGLSEPVIRAKASNLDMGRLVVLLDILEGNLGNAAVRVALNDYILGKAEENL